MNKKFKIKTVINEVFTILCPASIQKVKSATTFAFYDYETNCAYDEQPLSSTAFCGSCALKNSDYLFWNVNSPLTYNQVNLFSSPFNSYFDFFLNLKAMFRLQSFFTNIVDHIKCLS